MRNLYFILICFGLTGCSVIHPIISKIRQHKPVVIPTAVTSTDHFLDPIFPPAYNGRKQTTSQIGFHSLNESKNIQGPKLTASAGVVPQKLEIDTVVKLVPSPLMAKYAQLLGQQAVELPDSNLLLQIDPWIGVRYRNGGNSIQGIDCSAFTATILHSYRGVQLPRTCKEQFHYCERIKKEELQVGDLIFFKTRGRSISHVGIYLGNDKFVHASSSNGVMVSDRREPYFSTRYVGAGRVPVF